MLVLSAAGLVLAMIFTALAVDIGFLAADKRTDQKIADMAALDASRNLNNIQPLAEASALRNGFVTDPKRTVFAELVAPDGSGDYAPSATGKFVRVTIKSPRKPFFPFVSPNERIVSARAVAGGEPEAEISVGSTLASLDVQKSALDAILGPMLGTNSSPLNLNAVSYQGLASGNVDLRALQTNLLNMGYDVGTPEKLLNTNVRAADLLTATAQALGQKSPPDTVALVELNKIPIPLIPNLKTVALGSLISLSQPSADSALDAKLNAFDIVSGAAQVSNGSNFVAVPGINVSIPGVLPNTLSVGLSVIEPAQRAKGPVNAPAYTTVAKTSQVVLQVKLNLAPLGLNVLSTTLNFTAGNGKATLKNIDCAAPSILVTGETSGATISGNVNGNVLGIPLVGTLNVTGTVGAAAAADRTFSYPTQFRPPVGPTPAFSYHVGVANVGLAPIFPPGLTLSGTGALGLLTGLVEPVLENVVTALDTALVPTLGPILKVLGLDLAGADLGAIDIFDPPPSCSSTKLVK
ncbi:MAG: hypothetical protein QOH36_767 [Actinomycetota bacterium]|nr:hypothetical protein [Actinomycetota bacterium]